MQRLDWLVVVDIFLTRRPRSGRNPASTRRTSRPRCSRPGRAGRGEDGSLTNTCADQWHEKAVDPRATCRRRAVLLHAGPPAQKMYAGTRRSATRGSARQFTYGAKPDHPEMGRVLKEINGRRHGGHQRQGRQVLTEGQPIIRSRSSRTTQDDVRLLDLHGCDRRSPDGKLINKRPRASRRGHRLPGARLGLRVAGTAASSTTRLRRLTGNPGAKGRS